MKKIPALILIGTWLTSATFAQQSPQPFAPQPDPPQAQPGSPQTTAQPDTPLSNGIPRPFDMGGANSSGRPSAPEPATTIPSQPTSRPNQEQPTQNISAPVAGPPGRFILTAETMRLEGEIDRRAWSIFLTQEELANEATLVISYTNAVVVMPEASRLKVSLNGETVADAPIESPNGPRVLRIPVRRNLLRPGQNWISFEATQRHRTDCSIDATYELWTQIDSATTGLDFGRPILNRLRSLDDLPAVGIDVKGMTTLRTFAPGVGAGASGNRLLRAVQAIAVRGRYQHLVVDVMDAPSFSSGPGAVTMVMGTANELRSIFGNLPPEAMARPWVGFVTEPNSGSSVLVITGASASDLDSAVETLAAPTLRPQGVIRTEIDTSSWSTPDPPLVGGEATLKLSAFEITTQEFSGRRFNMSFKIALPSDFYADAYGEAVLYLDAAYTSAVRPGSHFDVYVNGRITSTLALNGTNGGIFQHFPVKLTLRNFKPGVNEVVIEGIFLTESDAQCFPGATVPGPDRFVLFDTSDIVFPRYGRIGRHPNLSAFAASGFPYLLSASPVPLIIGRHDAAHYGATATLLARVAYSAGRPVPIDTSATLLSIGNRPALIIGTAGQVAPSLLSVMGVADTIRNTWSTPAAPQIQPPPSVEQPYDAVVERFRSRQVTAPETATASEVPPTGTEEIRDRWRQSLGEGAVRREFLSLTGWISRTFDISLTSLNLFEQTVVPFMPNPQMPILIAQGMNPQEGAPWTVLIGREEEGLKTGIARLTERRMWSNVTGQLSAIQPQNPRIVTRAPARTEFLETQPFSLLNTRQVIANWLSTNIVFYAGLLMILCMLLGTATSIMLKGLGRQ